MASNSNKQCIDYLVRMMLIAITGAVIYSCFNLGFLLLGKVHGFVISRYKTWKSLTFDQINEDFQNNIRILETINVSLMDKFERT